MITLKILLLISLFHYHDHYYYYDQLVPKYQVQSPEGLKFGQILKFNRKNNWCVWTHKRNFTIFHPPCPHPLRLLPGRGLERNRAVKYYVGFLLKPIKFHPPLFDNLFLWVSSGCSASQWCLSLNNGCYSVRPSVELCVADSIISFLIAAAQCRPIRLSGGHNWLSQGQPRIPQTSQS